jgi:hypothetical protein
MAKQDVMTPGAYGGGSKKKKDEFTFDEFMDSIAQKSREQNEKARRDKTFSQAFRSMLATPQEYTDWQDEQYAQINKNEALRQEAEKQAEAMDPVFSRRANDFLNDEIVAAFTGAALGGTGTPIDDLLLNQIIKDTANQTEPPGIPFSHDDLIEAAGGTDRLTKKDLEWLESMDEEIETGRVTDSDMNHYMRLQHIRDRAKAIIIDGSW